MYSNAQEPLRPNKGCLWGCTGALVAAVVIVVAVFGYGAWYFYKGFANDNRIQTILKVASASEQATAILGNPIKVEEVELHTYDYETGHGGTASYILKVAGPRGHGEIKADLEINEKSSQEITIRRMVLTDDDGRSYFLIGAAPPNPMMQNSI